MGAGDAALAASGSVSSGSAHTLPELFRADADFIVKGEPESAMLRLVAGDVLDGVVTSPRSSDLDALPFPWWDPLSAARSARPRAVLGRPAGGSLPVLASRSCPEFCTYCPHRIQASYRTRSVGNILDELQYLQDTRGPVHVVFRDPLFTQDRERVLASATGSAPRAAPHLRVRDQARSPRRRAARHDAARPASAR